MDHEPGLARLRARRPARESLDSIWLPPEKTRRQQRAGFARGIGWISGARCRPVEERARGAGVFGKRRCEGWPAGRNGLARGAGEPNWYKPGFVGEKYVGPVVLLSGACKAQ